MSPLALALVFALAQSAPAAPKPPAPTPAPTRPEAQPYEADLLRLAELMGALAYLRDLCHDGDGAAFRDRIGKLIAADPRPQEAKDLLAGAFNRGFDGYRLTYRVCTSNARSTISTYLDESERIARDVAAKFGGG
ncbi:MAG: TIGR02301 family protein [Pseudomonadota bacterium]|nr:TIGR02301 family protein [Pseudomonadota bacterium]